MAKVWIRADKGDGSISEISEEAVLRKLQGNWRNPEAVMKLASPAMPVFTLFANYWPKEQS